MRVDKGEIQKRDIIEKSLKLFSENGYANTNLEDIAIAVGISRGPLYYHYNNKYDLFCSAAEAFFEKHIEILRKIFESDNSIFEQIEEPRQIPEFTVGRYYHLRQ